MLKKITRHAQNMVIIISLVVMPCQFQIMSASICLIIFLDLKDITHSLSKWSSLGGSNGLKSPIQLCYFLNDTKFLILRMCVLHGALESKECVPKTNNICN